MIITKSWICKSGQAISDENILLNEHWTVRKF